MVKGAEARPQLGSCFGIACPSLETFQVTLELNEHQR